jgi:thiol-disulfide isomerase/thioredoxin
MQTLLVGLLFVMGVQAASAFGPDWVGKAAPDFTLKTLDGTSDLSLKDFRGNVVVIDFWASWCAPCRRSLPELASLESKNVKVLAVNIDDVRQNGIEFLKRNRITLRALYDGEKRVASRYDVPAMPSALIIDKQGVVRYLHIGYGADDMNAFKQQIERLR